ncbi:putative Fe-S oxidoreductase [Archaeoglobus sulfaticallidus PM70-1]|uniref:Putative Fe-S oxidoreductase n=1 Tax=Archaeoglobus sulfaticallidus PM70-1 TaxID=387631 RepID=N0BH04_9EURY|nr:radical SAM protein [Archaeoglobus sulfaticallidus]AGK61552.1 putative Fe-S oxidoreductase [Archaeoglobus sulfaticallidus PM70-1]
MMFRFFQIEVTRKCNMSCLMCPHAVFPKESLIHMDFEIFERISTYFDKTELIHLQGWGEPLLHSRIGEMIAIAKDSKASVGLTTNGVLIKKFVEELLNLDYIAISVGGIERHKLLRGNDFQKLVENIRLLSELRGSANPKINITYLMTIDNFKELPEVIRKLNFVDGFIVTNLDCVFSEKVYGMRVFDRKDIRNEVEKTLKKCEALAAEHGIAFKSPSVVSVERTICDAFPDSAVVFSAEGEVYPCVYLNLPFEKIQRIFRGRKFLIEKPSFGNITEMDLEEIWNQREYKDFRDVFRRRGTKIFSLKRILGLESVNMPEYCKGCYKIYGI